MNLDQLREKHINGELTDEAWEELSRKMIPMLLNHQKKEHWAQLLAEKGIHRKPAAKLYLFKKYLAAAAVVTGLAIALWWALPQPNASVARQLAAQHLEQPFPFNSSATRGDIGNDDLYRGMATEAFNNRDYEKTLSYLRQIEAEHRAGASDYFLMGLSLIYQKAPDYAKAIEAFERAKALNPDKYKDEIQWFEALCALMLDDKAAARKYLMDIEQSPSSRKREQAIELLKEL